MRRSSSGGVLGAHRARQGEAAGMVVPLALALVLVLSAEMCIDVLVVAIGAGRVLLAFGIALDACARALGTIAAERTGRLGWAWGCALGGSPAVAAFALDQGSDEMPVEPAPLAALLSLLAGLIIAIAALSWALGS